MTDKQSQLEKIAAANQKSKENPLVKFALEFGPLLAFFISFYKYNLITATKVLMVGVVIALILSLLIHRKIAIMPLVTAFFVLIFGGLTLYLQDDTFIKMKPTIVNLFFATLLLGAYKMGHLLIKYVLGDALQLEEKGWRLLTIRWGLFFIALAVLNEIIWRNFSSDFWVNFKTFGILPLTIIFSIFQIDIINKYMIEPEDPPQKS